MRLTVLELPARWGPGPAAVASLDALLGDAATDLVLVPELAFTGYVSPRGDFDASRFAEPLGGPTLEAAARLCRRRRTHLAAPLPLREGDAISNAVIVVGPDGALVSVYRKRHPWFPERWATPGREPHPIFQIGGVTLTIAICFDGHFLAEEAGATLAAADALLFPSAWVDDEDSRRPLLAGIARDFGLTVANANWAEGVVRVPGQGGSCVFQPEGSEIGRSPRIDVVLSKKIR